MLAVRKPACLSLFRGQRRDVRPFHEGIADSFFRE